VKDFDRETLAEANGEEGKPVYIAYAGGVFDVSGSQLWKTGRHMQRHSAGTDLTDELPAAPHGPEVLTRVPRVGALPARPAAVPAASPHSRLDAVLARFPMLERHPHPMAVHFPIVLLLAVVLFKALFVITGDPSFATTARHCLAAGIVSLPPAMATGFFTWWLNYHAKPMKVVLWKIGLSTVLFAVAAGVLFRETQTSGIPTGTVPNIVHAIFVLSFVPLVSLIGWLGAMLTFPVKPAATPPR
jgi:predicted heme/steroid binding protein/uncharacterized membrane protein